MRVELPENNEEVRALFELQQPAQVLAFASEEVLNMCSEPNGPALLPIADKEVAAKYIREREIQLVLVDPDFGTDGKQSGVLDMSNASTPARELLRYLRENCSGVPVYLLRTP